MNDKFSKFITGAIIMLLSIMYGGFVFSNLWAWIVSPVLGIAAISLPQAIALRIVWGYLIFAIVYLLPQKEESFSTKIFVSLFAETMFLGLGYVASLFI